MKLTDIKCKSAKPLEKPWKMSDGGGMYLEIMPNGSKYWRMKYRFHGKEKRLALGVYPETSLAEARDKRDKARKQLQDGIDPSFQKQEDKRFARLNSSQTFEAVAREWHEHSKARWSEGYATELMNRLERDIFPEIGTRPIADLTPPHILQVMRKIESRVTLDPASNDSIPKDLPAGL